MDSLRQLLTARDPPRRRLLIEIADFLLEGIDRVVLRVKLPLKVGFERAFRKGPLGPLVESLPIELLPV